MPLTLHSMPFDILYNISGSLNFVEYLSLRDTDRQLRSVFSGESICKKAVEVVPLIPSMSVTNQLIGADYRYTFRIQRRRSLQEPGRSPMRTPCGGFSAGEKHSLLRSRIRSLSLATGLRICIKVEFYAMVMTSISAF